MIRLFVPSELGDNQTLSLSAEHQHYLLHVMRQKAGDSLALFNGKDGEWQARIEALDKKQAVLQTEHLLRPQTIEQKLILCPALIKKEHMDWVFQKATELGASEIYPLLTDRTVISKLNIDRARSIVTEAAEQCERLTVPQIHTPQKLRDFLAHLPADYQPICLSERTDSQGQIDPQKIPALCIGPEGGWTPTELDLFKSYSIPFWHFGHTILRAETAALVALTCFAK